MYKKIAVLSKINTAMSILSCYDQLFAGGGCGGFCCGGR